MEEVIVEGPKKKDYFIKLDSEAGLTTTLYEFCEVDEEGNRELIMHSRDHCFDIVGVIHKPSGQTLVDSEGNEYPEMVAVDGYHVNLRLLSEKYREAADAVDSSHGTNPATPHRVWL